MTIHEVEQVEESKSYILTGWFLTAPAFGTCEVWHPERLMIRIGDAECTYDVKEFIENGGRLYGPISLQPAQESAGESEAG